MALELVPPDRAAQTAVEAAVASSRLAAAPDAPSECGAWLAAARVEAVDRDPRGADGYALSPRSTRGATRA